MNDEKGAAVGSPFLLSIPFFTVCNPHRWRISIGHGTFLNQTFITHPNFYYLSLDMEKLFRDGHLQEKLDADGILTQPLLRPEEVQAIRKIYDELHPNGLPPQMRDGIHMTIWCSDRAYKDQVRERLLAVLQPACARAFQDFRICSPVFIVKRKGADTTFPIHQDWNVVDEEHHRAFNVWTPLYDVDAENGSLWHVPGTHRLPTPIRGPGILFPNLYGIQDHIAPAMQSVPLKAGEAMVFYHRLIHGSPPNTQENPRIVVSFSLLPKDVPLHIYFQKDEDSPLEVYHPDDLFIYDFDNVRDTTAFIPPDTAPIAQKPPYSPVLLTPESFDQHFPGLIPKQATAKPSVWQKLKAAFGAK